MQEVNSRITEREWRLDNLYYVINKNSEKVPFVRNNIQRQLSLVTAKRKMVLKSRQVGISTQELLSCADFTFFEENKTVCILAHEQDAIEKLFRIVHRAYEFMPEWAKPTLDRGGGSKYELFFPEINSRIYCDLESRGDTIHKLHVSEMAFMKDLKRLKSTIECVPMASGEVTIETTPNGLNSFYQMWVDENTNYARCFYPWFFHEEYRIENHELKTKDVKPEEWKFIKNAKSLYKIDISLEQLAYRRFKQNDQKETFKQEYPEDDITCFLTSGNAPFDLAIVKPMYDAAKPPIEEIDGIKIYEHMIPGKIYVLGADTAEGVEGDYSEAHVFEVSRRKQVATFRSNSMKPSEFADVIDQMAQMYSHKYPILVGVERNNHGHAVLLKLDEVLMYPNLFRHRTEEGKDLEKVRLGWITDKVTRPIMMETLREGVQNETVQLTDKTTLGQCLTLVYNNGKIEAETGNHDDAVIASAIAVQMCLEESKLGIYSDIGSKIKV